MILFTLRWADLVVRIVTLLDICKWFRMLRLTLSFGFIIRKLRPRNPCKADDYDFWSILLLHARPVLTSM